MGRMSRVESLLNQYIVANKTYYNHVMFIISSGMLSVGGHYAPHHGSPSISVIVQICHVVQVIWGQYQWGRWHLSPPGRARLAHQVVFCCIPIGLKIKRRAQWSVTIHSRTNIKLTCSNFARSKMSCNLVKDWCEIEIKPVNAVLPT